MASDINISEKRKLVEAHILKYIDMLEPSGTNTKLYEELFKSLNDNDFDQLMSDVRDKKRKLVVLYVPNMKINLKLANIFKVADEIGLEIFERINLIDEATGRKYLTPHKYMVVRLPVRRLKQLLMSKISIPEGDSKTDTFTGQVIAPDKGSSISAVESQVILSKGLTVSMMELLNVRGGNTEAYSNMKSQLQETGRASLNEIDTDSRVRSSVVLSTYLRSMLLDNNLA